MMTFLIIVHGIICFLLITLVLIQRGRGGGLVDSFSSVESMFGTKTNTFLTRATTVLSVMFFFTCLSLAILSVRQSKSLLSDRGSVQAAVPAPSNQTPVTPLTTSNLNTQEPTKAE